MLSPKSRAAALGRGTELPSSFTCRYNCPPTLQNPCSCRSTTADLLALAPMHPANSSASGADVVVWASF